MKRKIVFLLSTLLISPQTWAEGDWYLQGGAQTLFGDYGESKYFESLRGIGFFIKADYLEKSSLIAGAKYNSKQYNSNVANAPSEMVETIAYVGVVNSLYLDNYPGKLSFRFDVYVGRDDFSGINVGGSGSMGGGGKRTVSIKDNFGVYNIIISYLNNSKTYYWDLGLAYSLFKSGSSDLNVNFAHPNKTNIVNTDPADDIRVTQWSPTLGFGFNRSMDWLQLRGYLMHFSESDRIAFKQSSAAIEAKWLHWFSYDSFLNLHNFNVTLLAGKRIYAVDSDSYSLYNSSDMQKNAASLGAEWKLGSQYTANFYYGVDKYEDLVESDAYTNTYVFLKLSKKWQ